MAKRHGTHPLLRDQERFAHELIERKFPGAQINIADFQGNVNRDNGVLIIYSGTHAVLFRDGKRWDAIQHGITDPGEDDIKGIDLTRFSDQQMTPPEGSEGVQGEGWL